MNDSETATTDDAAHSQIAGFLRDAHSIEQQALVQMRQAPKMLDDDTLVGIFTEHLGQTGQHEHRVRERLEELDSGPSAIKDLAGKAGGWGMAAFARMQPDTPGKLIAHAYSYERMEQAAYELLALIAEQDGDIATAQLAQSIAEQEAAMAERIAAQFDRAADLSLAGADSPAAIASKLDTYLADAHAIEVEAAQLLSSAPSLVREPGLAAVLREHLDQTRSHADLIEGCLERRGAKPSRAKDVALRVGALNLAGFFTAQPETPVKLTGFAFAFEHLEIAAYELLARTARRAGDSETAQVAERIVHDEHLAASAVRDHFAAVAAMSAVRHVTNV